jgi:hypothetical protein
VEEPTRPTERIPPAQPPPPGTPVGPGVPPPPAVPPTAAVPPAGAVPARTAVAATTGAVYPYDDVPLWDELRRIRFWSYFGSGMAALAAILSGIALFVALDARDKAEQRDDSRPALQGLRQDVSDLRNDVSEARAASRDAADQGDRLNARVKRLEGATSNQSDVTDRLDQIQQDITALNDRVDQVERAQEQAASGGP